jgi:hypothetical protein
MSQPHVCSHCGRSYDNLTSSELYKFKHFCPSELCLGHATYAVLHVIKSKRFAEDEVLAAQARLEAANGKLAEAIAYHDSMDEIAIPDGEGHFYIVGPNPHMIGTHAIQVRHTSNMQYTWQPPDLPDEIENA